MGRFHPGAVQAASGGAPDPPGNDDFANATTISLAAADSLAGTLFSSTIERADETEWLSFEPYSVWYKFTAGSTGMATLSMIGNGSYVGADTCIVVWEDPVSVAALDPNDPYAWADDNAVDDSAILQLPVTSGNEYYVQCSSYDGEITFDLEWTTIGPLPTMPSYVETSSGAINGVSSFSTSRPTGTASDDLLLLMFSMLSSETSGPTLTGWTPESGPTQVGGGPKFALYSRVADMTATDTPSPTLVGTTNAGWVMTAWRDTDGVDIDGIASLSNASSDPINGHQRSTSVPNGLVIWMGLEGDNVTLATPGGGDPSIVHHSYTNGTFWGGAVASLDMPFAEISSPCSFDVTGTPTNAIVFTIALLGAV